MRGADVQQGGLFSYVSEESWIPANHPLRAVRTADRGEGGAQGASVAMSRPDRGATRPWTCTVSGTRTRRT